jgi:hypothetical protein
MTTEQPAPQALGETFDDEDLIDYSEHEDDYITPVKSRFPSPSELKASEQAVATATLHEAATVETTARTVVESFDFVFEDAAAEAGEANIGEGLNAREVNLDLEPAPSDQAGQFRPAPAIEVAPANGQDTDAPVDEVYKIDYEDGDGYSQAPGEDGASEQPDLEEPTDFAHEQEGGHWEAEPDVVQSEEAQATDASPTQGLDNEAAYDALGAQDEEHAHGGDEAAEDEPGAVPDDGITYEDEDQAADATFEYVHHPAPSAQNGQVVQPSADDDDDGGVETSDRGPKDITAASEAQPNSDHVHDENLDYEASSQVFKPAQGSIDDALDSIMENARERKRRSGSYDEYDDMDWPEINVTYKGDDYPMFARDDLSFFYDMAVLNEPISALLKGLRQNLISEIGSDDELLFEIPDLGLKFSEVCSLPFCLPSWS